MPSTSTTSRTYAQQHYEAAAIAAGLQTLLELIRREPAAAQALALIDTTDMRGPLDTAGLQSLLAEATAERDRCAALAERDARRKEAGLSAGAVCVCGHADTFHAGRLTEDDRLPCAHQPCPCHDLAFV